MNLPRKITYLFRIALQYKNILLISSQFNKYNQGSTIGHDVDAYNFVR